ncbi:MAG: hypothetical protein WC295_00925 [Methanoregula sp.]
MPVIAAACIAGCTNQQAPDTPGIRSPSFPETTQGTPPGATCPDIRTQVPGVLTWVSSPPADTPGAGLLSGAKALMIGIYSYSLNSPDYLPTSYTNLKTSDTSYVIHAVDPGSVAWAPAGETQVAWKSRPGGVPEGWSGIVTAAGPVRTRGDPEELHVLTDCSGFITSLFTFANTVHATQFTGWKTGSTIPEAGCFNPQGGCDEPSPLNYYHLFISGREGFRSVSLTDLQPGDLVAVANTKNRDDSGHIMLVAAVSSCANDPTSRLVVVIDETESPHSYDTRLVKVSLNTEKTGGGIGMGIIRLSDSPNNTLRFYWGTNDTAPQVGMVALGRAL